MRALTKMPTKIFLQVISLSRSMRTADRLWRIFSCGLQGKELPLPIIYGTEYNPETSYFILCGDSDKSYSYEDLEPVYKNILQGLRKANLLGTVVIALPTVNDPQLFERIQRISAATPLDCEVVACPLHSYLPHDQEADILRFSTIESVLVGGNLMTSSIFFDIFCKPIMLNAVPQYVTHTTFSFISDMSDKITLTMEALHRDCRERAKLLGISKESLDKLFAACILKPYMRLFPSGL